jgi:hypothetical protein
MVLIPLSVEKCVFPCWYGATALPYDYEECCLLGCYAVSLVRTDVSEERSASIIRVTRIG